jgi:hypothetical protein
MNEEIAKCIEIADRYIAEMDEKYGPLEEEGHHEHSM